MDDRITVLLEESGITMAPGHKDSEPVLNISKNGHHASIGIECDGSDIGFLDAASAALLRFDINGHIKAAIRAGEGWAEADWDDIKESAENFDVFLTRVSNRMARLSDTMKKDNGIRRIGFRVHTTAHVNGYAVPIPGGLTEAEREEMYRLICDGFRCAVSDPDAHGDFEAVFEGGKALEEGPGGEGRRHGWTC